MTSLERLRLATALSHTVPDTELRMRTDRSEWIVVGRGSDADIDPCAMRRVVAASACSKRPDISAHIVELSLGGSITDIGGGVFASGRNGIEQRWIATLLAPDRVTRLLDDVDHPDAPDHAVHARLTRDPQLGVTVVAMTTGDLRFHESLDEIALLAAGGCFVSELQCAAAPYESTSDAG